MFYRIWFNAVFAKGNKEMKRLNQSILASIILLCSGLALAEEDLNQPDDLKLVYQACVIKLNANRDQERDQINTAKALCAQQYQDEKQEAKCLISALQGLAEHGNVVAAEFLANLYTKVNKKEEARKWVNLQNTIMNKKFPDCA